MSKFENFDFVTKISDFRQERENRRILAQKCVFGPDLADFCKNVADSLFSEARFWGPDLGMFRFWKVVDPAKLFLAPEREKQRLDREFDFDPRNIPKMGPKRAEKLENCKNTQNFDF